MVRDRQTLDLLFARYDTAHTGGLSEATMRSLLVELNGGQTVSVKDLKDVMLKVREKGRDTCEKEKRENLAHKARKRDSHTNIPTLNLLQPERSPFPFPRH